MAVAPTPENFRSEMARHHLLRRDLAARIGMHPSDVSQFVCGSKPLVGWAAHNLGAGINLLAGKRLIDVDDSLGLLEPPPPGRPKSWNKPEAMDPMRKRSRPKPKPWFMRKRKIS